ncbi:MAG: ABC transporter ATP-binding protein [Rhizobiales bacterium]|nr:ABC transporter ATP-binding protein [Hyphomicrobiales bacterium]
MKSAVEILGIEKRFGPTVAIEHVDLAIDEGEFLSLLGASGCGKSTLLRIIAGFESPTRGRIKIQGEDVTGWPPHRRPSNIVFQRGALFPHMNVFDNIAYSLRLRKWPRKRIAEKVEEMLALVRLEDLGHRGANELSGGQIQRVALARALAAEPRVLLLDEPLSALDLKLREQMQLELRTIQRQLGATFVFVTHDQTEALVMSDRIAIMNQGHLVQLGTPREIYTRPASVFASAFIGQTNLIRCTVAAVEGSTVTVEIGGQRMPAASPASLSPGEPATLSVRPEAVRVHRIGPEAPFGIDAKVAEIIYLGSSIRIGAAINGDAIVWADLRDEEAEGLTPGMDVRLAWPPTAIVWKETSK